MTPTAPAIADVQAERLLGRCGEVAISQPEHLPVLVGPLLDSMRPAPGQTVLDGTVGLGGHAEAILPHILPGGTYIGLDVDQRMLETARERLAPFGAAVRLEPASYADLDAVLEAAGVDAVHHVLLDLGVNSAQLDDAERGFSFERDGPLDMRFDPSHGRPALELVNALGETELATLFYEYGQESLSRKIARRICQVRHHGRIRTTRMLAQVVESAVSAAGRAPRGRVHPATRVFQALRIAVNCELDNLKSFLERVPNRLLPGGTVSIISYHSLEDGMVKRSFRAGKAAGTLTELTRQPVLAGEEERNVNPRSRSAKLRVARRTE